jgi:hypothetical protein
MYRNVIGSKYEATRDLDIAEIAKRIRKELAAAFTGGWKFRVRISRYSMGRSLNVDLLKAPYVLVEKAPDRDEGMIQWQLNARGKLAEEKAKGIVDAYNYDRSEPESDYFDSRFNGGVDFGELARKQWAELEGRKARQAQHADDRRGAEQERLATVHAFPVQATRSHVGVTWIDDLGRRQRGRIVAQGAGGYLVESNGIQYQVPLDRISNVGAGKRKRAEVRLCVLCGRQMGAAAWKAHPVCDECGRVAQRRAAGGKARHGGFTTFGALRTGATFRLPDDPSGPLSRKLGPSLYLHGPSGRQFSTGDATAVLPARTGGKKRHAPTRPARTSRPRKTARAPRNLDAFMKYDAMLRKLARS